MTGLVYDTGALLAAATGDRAVWALHRGALERNELPVVPAPVLAQALGVSGPSDPLTALLRGCALADFPVAAARDAGRLLAHSRTGDLVAAVVVLAALATRSAVVTSNAAGVLALARSIGVNLALAPVPSTMHR